MMESLKEIHDLYNRLLVFDRSDLRAARMRAGLTLRELGERIGYSGPHVSQAENNRCPCSARYIALVYQAVIEAINEKRRHPTFNAPRKRADSVPAHLESTSKEGMAGS